MELSQGNELILRHGHSSFYPCGLPRLGEQPEGLAPKEMTFLPRAKSGGEGRALPAAYSLARSCQPWVEKPGADPLGRPLGSQPPPSSPFLSSSYFISSTGTSPARLLPFPTAPPPPPSSLRHAPFPAASRSGLVPLW